MEKFLNSFDVWENLVKTNTRALVLADEHQALNLLALAPLSQYVDVLTNRYDIAQQATDLGLNAFFSDWDVFARSDGDVWPHGQYTYWIMPVCKEKLVNRHLIEQACQLLPIGSHLLLSGQKDQGIHSLWKYACNLFNSSARLKKEGVDYIGQLTKTQINQTPVSHYHDFQIIGHDQEHPIFSKPGVYGWQKIDHGSACLTQCLPDYLTTVSTPIQSILDLGCGYGYLTLAAAHLLPKAHFYATDNNAAALLCTQKNGWHRELSLQVFAGDCGNTGTTQVDLVLCNPPFHQGFDIENQLTDRFLKAAHRLLKPTGHALFVVNSFIPLEKKAQSVFKHVRTLLNDKHFKVVALIKS